MTAKVREGGPPGCRFERKDIGSLFCENRPIRALPGVTLPVHIAVAAWLRLPPISRTPERVPNR